MRAAGDHRKIRHASIKMGRLECISRAARRCRWPRRLAFQQVHRSAGDYVQIFRAKAEQAAGGVFGLDDRAVLGLADEIDQAVLVSHGGLGHQWVVEAHLNLIRRGADPHGTGRRSHPDPP